MSRRRIYRRVRVGLHYINPPKIAKQLLGCKIVDWHCHLKYIHSDKVCPIVHGRYDLLRALPQDCSSPSKHPRGPTSRREHQLMLSSQHTQGNKRRAGNPETKHAKHMHVENQRKRAQAVKESRQHTHTRPSRTSTHCQCQGIQPPETTASEPTSMIIAIAHDLQSSNDEASNRNGTEAHRPIHRPRLHVASLTQ